MEDSEVTQVVTDNGAPEAPAQTQTALTTGSLTAPEDLRKELEKVRREAAATRVKLKKFEEAEEAAKLAQMTELDRLKAERDAATKTAAEMKQAARLALLESQASALADTSLAPKLIDVSAMPDEPGEARQWAAAQVADLLARVPGLARQTTPVVAPTNGQHAPPAKQLTPDEILRARLLAQAGLGQVSPGGTDYFSNDELSRHGGGYSLPREINT